MPCLRHQSSRRFYSAAGYAFRPTARGAHGGPISAPSAPSNRLLRASRKGKEGGDAVRDAQTDVPSARRLRAQLAFKDSMVHGILQFTPSIAFRYVLHRCESRDIRCRESFRLSRYAASPWPHRGREPKGQRFYFCFPWRLPRRDSLAHLVRAPGKHSTPPSKISLA